jgi:hypothetical protein
MSETKPRKPKVNNMRPQTQRRIDALHAEIERLVQMEKDYHRRKQPGMSQLHRDIEEARIDVAAWSPRMRRNCVLEGRKL